MSQFQHFSFIQVWDRQRWPKETHIYFNAVIYFRRKFYIYAPQDQSVVASCMHDSFAVWMLRGEHHLLRLQLRGAPLSAFGRRKSPQQHPVLSEKSIHAFTSESPKVSSCNRKRFGGFESLSFPAEGLLYAPGVWNQNTDTNCDWLHNGSWFLHNQLQRCCWSFLPVYLFKYGHSQCPLGRATLP